jgi:hypothetical protein
MQRELHRRLALLRTAVTFSDVYVPFLHAVLRRVEMRLAIAAWASYDAEWTRLVDAYRLHYASTAALAPLLASSAVMALNRQLEPPGGRDRWPYIPIPAAPIADAPPLAAAALGHWPLRARGIGRYIQEVLLSQSVVLFNRL